VVLMRQAPQGWIAATNEIIIIHVDMGLRKSTPFPPDVLASIEAMREAHACLPIPPQVGHRIGIPKK
jgi:acyl-CoA thioester hydrolase